MGLSEYSFRKQHVSVHRLLRPSSVPRRPVRYVPPLDDREKHYPGMNYCGPGTNVWKRMKLRIKPVDELDALCFQHDLDTEPRGPYKSKGRKAELRASDKRLIRNCRMLLRKYPLDPRIHAVISIMQLVLDHGVRGR